MTPSIYQRLQLASLIQRNMLEAARTYAANQTQQGGTDWSACAEAMVVYQELERAA